MADSQFLSVIRMWAAVAWADGQITEAESQALRRLVGAADLDDAERATAYSFLDAKVDLVEGEGSQLSEDARRGVYRAACRMAAVDHAVADAERSLLQRLKAHLGLADEVAAEVERGVPGLA
jgi:uncharacterized membrane protein YebE (DUF533 family)